MNCFQIYIISEKGICWITNRASTWVHPKALLKNWNLLLLLFHPHFVWKIVAIRRQLSLARNCVLYRVMMGSWYWSRCWGILVNSTIVNKDSFFFVHDWYRLLLKGFIFISIGSRIGFIKLTTLRVMEGTPVYSTGTGLLKETCLSIDFRCDCNHE